MVIFHIHSSQWAPYLHAGPVRQCFCIFPAPAAAPGAPSSLTVCAALAGLLAADEARDAA